MLLEKISDISEVLREIQKNNQIFMSKFLSLYALIVF